VGLNPLHQANEAIGSLKHPVRSWIVGGMKSPTTFVLAFSLGVAGCGLLASAQDDSAVLRAGRRAAELNGPRIRKNPVSETWHVDQSLSMTFSPTSPVTVWNPSVDASPEAARYARTNVPMATATGAAPAAAAAGTNAASAQAASDASGSETNWHTIRSWPAGTEDTPVEAAPESPPIEMRAGPNEAAPEAPPVEAGSTSPEAAPEAPPIEISPGANPTPVETPPVEFPPGR
jgi:hypothetical protein